MQINGEFMRFLFGFSLLLLLSGCIVTTTSASGSLNRAHLMDRVYKSGFVPGTEDIPLQRGFKLIENSAVVYDTPAGRIVKAQYQSQIFAADKIMEFYNSALHQLGWVVISENRYRRNREKLTIDIAPNGTNNFVYFTLEPLAS